jgi:hypothetical protein
MFDIIYAIFSAKLISYSARWTLLMKPATLLFQRNREEVRTKRERERERGRDLGSEQGRDDKILSHLDHFWGYW